MNLPPGVPDLTDGNGNLDPVKVQAWHDQEALMIAAAEVVWQTENTARNALTAVLSLLAAYPYPTPEETAIVDAQAASSLDGFRDLADPPADVVALAAAVASWRAAL